MIEYIENLVSAVANLQNTQNAHTLSAVKDCLEAAVPGRNCVDIMYTSNIDKLPFGCIVTPYFEANQINDILIAGEDMVIKNYYVEIDSKLTLYGLTARELTAVMLYNVLHMVEDETPVRRLRNIIDRYFMEHYTQLKIRESVQYQAILEYGLTDTLIKLTNCLYIDSDVITDAKLEELELGEDFNSALNKLFRKIPGCETVASRHPNLIIMDWCFRLYRDVEKERIPAIHQLARASEINASVLYKRVIDNAITALHRIDTDVEYHADALMESYICESKRKNGLFSQMKLNGLRAIEDDFYEFMIMARNAETEYEVMYALKQINARLAILDDYIRNTEMSDEDKKRWTELYTRYITIREEIAKKKVYNRKNYGIFVDYNKLDQMSDDDAYDKSDIYN